MTQTTSTSMSSAALNAKPAATTDTLTERSIRIRLLRGVLAGPLYLVVSYAQALTRGGFDLTRNAFSFLSLGDFGWIQVTNFVVVGLLFVVAATGVRRALPAGSGSTWAPRLIGALGAMIAGGGFLIDPPTVTRSAHRPASPMCSLGTASCTASHSPATHSARPPTWPNCFPST